MRQATIDKHAIRHGQECVGWIVILTNQLGEVHDFCGVRNVIYPTQERAEKAIQNIHPSYVVTIKALRVAKDLD